MLRERIELSTSPLARPYLTECFQVPRQCFRITIRRSNTDQEGQGEVIPVIRGGTTCPVKAVKGWLNASGICNGPLFRPVAKGGRLGASRLTDKPVYDLVRAYAARLGLNPDDFGAHSLRSRFLTSAARRGASVFKMRDVSRHKSMDVLQSYVRDAELFINHAGVGCYSCRRLGLGASTPKPSERSMSAIPRLPDYKRTIRKVREVPKD